MSRPYFRHQRIYLTFFILFLFCSIVHVPLQLCHCPALQSYRIAWKWNEKDPVIWRVFAMQAHTPKANAAPFNCQSATSTRSAMKFLHCPITLECPARQSAPDQVKSNYKQFFLISLFKKFCFLNISIAFSTKSSRLARRASARERIAEKRDPERVLVINK